MNVRSFNYFAFSIEMRTNFSTNAGDMTYKYPFVRLILGEERTAAVKIKKTYSR